MVGGRGRTMDMEDGFNGVTLGPARSRYSVPFVECQGLPGIHPQVSFLEGRTYFPVDSSALKTD